MAKSVRRPRRPLDAAEIHLPRRSEVPMEIRTTAFGEPKPSGKPVYCRSAARERRSCGARTECLARGAGRCQGGGVGAAPAICRSNRLGRGAELCRGCSRRCQGDFESTGDRVDRLQVDRTAASIFELVPGDPLPRRLWTDRRIDGPGEHLRSHSERSDHSAGGVPRPHAGPALLSRRRARGHGRIVGRGFGDVLGDASLGASPHRALRALCRA